MLEDVQERLVYRTHIYIQTDITGYKPAPGDLAYPDKLVMMEVGFPYVILISFSAPYTFWMFGTSENRIFLFNSHSRCKIEINLP